MSNDMMLRIEIWDKDTFSPDDLIGDGCLNIAPFMNGMPANRNNKRYVEYVNLTYKGRSAGSILVGIQCTPGMGMGMGMGMGYGGMPMNGMGMGGMPMGGMGYGGMPMNGMGGMGYGGMGMGGMGGMGMGGMGGYGGGWNPGFGGGY
jgi:hypothetical protein